MKKDVLKAGLMSAAFAGALSAGVMLESAPAEAASKVKCYGVAKAGENDCASADGKHACAGQSTVDMDPNEWKYVEDGKCEEMGGSTTPPKS